MQYDLTAIVNLPGADAGSAEVPLDALRVPRGEPLRLRLRLRSSAGVPVAAGGATVRLTVRERREGAAAVVNVLATPAPLRGPDALDLEVPGSATRRLRVARYLYQVSLVSGSDTYIVAGPAALEVADSLAVV